MKIDLPIIIDTKNENECIEVQKILFGLGYSWKRNGRKDTIDYLDIGGGFMIILEKEGMSWTFKDSYLSSEFNFNYVIANNFIRTKKLRKILNEKR